MGTRRKGALKQALSPFMGASSPASAQSAGTTQTQAIAAAATAFLDTLSGGQRAGVQFPFAPQPRATAARFKGGMRGDVDVIGEQYGRAMWSNYPVSDVPRPGLRLGSLDDAQRAGAMALLRVLLSDRGYRKVLDIMGSDQALADGSTPYASGRAAYTLASELVLGPGHDGETVQPAGVKASTLDQGQRAMLYDLILEWAGILDDAHAAPRLAEIRDGLDDTYFAWSGPTTQEPGRNGASYFRVQGPKLVIEFSPRNRAAT